MVMVDSFLGLETGLVDLVKTLPTGGGEGGGKVGNTELLSLEGCGGEADTEALEATGTAFGLVFEPMYLLEPCFVVVVAVKPWDAKTFGMTLAFILADIVFFAGIYVGVEVKDGGMNVVLEQPLDNGGGAGSTTGMKEDFVKPFRYFYAVLFLHWFSFRGAKVRILSEK